MLTSQFDVMFHLFRNLILTSTHHKKLALGLYYMIVPNLSVGETGAYGCDRSTGKYRRSQSVQTILSNISTDNACCATT